MKPFRPRHGARPLAAAVAVLGLWAGAGVASAAEPGAQIAKEVLAGQSFVTGGE